jgi:hypothetical protein
MTATKSALASKNFAIKNMTTLTPQKRIRTAKLRKLWEKIEIK